MIEIPIVLIYHSLLCIVCWISIFILSFLLQFGDDIDTVFQDSTIIASIIVTIGYIIYFIISNEIVKFV